MDNLDKETFLSQGFSSGNYANAYLSENLEIALEKSEIENLKENQEFYLAFILGFYATYETYEIPGKDINLILEAENNVGNELRKLGIACPER